MPLAKTLTTVCPPTFTRRPLHFELVRDSGGAKPQGKMWCGDEQSQAHEMRLCQLCQPRQGADTLLQLLRMLHQSIGRHLTTAERDDNHLLGGRSNG